MFKDGAEKYIEKSEPVPDSVIVFSQTISSTADLDIAAVPRDVSLERAESAPPAAAATKTPQRARTFLEEWGLRPDAGFKIEKGGQAAWSVAKFRLVNGKRGVLLENKNAPRVTVPMMWKDLAALNPALNKVKPAPVAED